MRSYLYEHLVSFEETNSLGNVYFSNFLKWQGICRERFVKQYAPELITQFSAGLKIATLSCSCTYYWELYAFDTVSVEMFLDDSKTAGIASEPDLLRLRFRYWRSKDEDRILAAEGEQTIAFMYFRPPDTWERGHLPEVLKTALIPFGLLAGL